MAGTITFDISAYDACADDLIAFRNANRAIHRDRDYFDWRYKLRPCSLPAFVVWARQEGQPVGAVSVFPHDYHVGDAEFPLGVVGDVSVSAELRGRGLAVDIIRNVNCELAERGLRGGLVLPTPAAARSFGKAGWTDLGPIRRYSKQLHFKHLVGRVIGNPIAAAGMSAPLDLLLRIPELAMRGPIRGWSCRECTRFDARFDDLWVDAPKSRRILGVRRSAYLRWRFESHPVTLYRILEVCRDDRLHGYVVFRCDGGICYVDDLLVDAEENAPLALKLLIRYLRAQEPNCDRVSVSVSEWWGGGRGWRHGFLLRPDFQQVMVWNLRMGPADVPVLMRADKDV